MLVTDTVDLARSAPHLLSFQRHLLGLDLQLGVQDSLALRVELLLRMDELNHRKSSASAVSTELSAAVKAAALRGLSAPRA